MARAILICAFVLITTVLLQEVVAQRPNNEDDVLTVDCIRCMCHARTGCFLMRNCALYSISKTYWARGGNNTIADDNPSDPAAYNRCLLHEGCIINTIRGYIRSFASTGRDCDCNDKVTCKDFTAIHLSGDDCRSDFKPEILRRFDTCATVRGIPNTVGWEMNCAIPDPV